MNRPDISIVIPVLNEAEGIVQALERLQEFRARGAEIIVVETWGSPKRLNSSSVTLAMRSKVRRGAFLAMGRF